MFEIEISATNILRAAHSGRRDLLADIVTNQLDIDCPDKSDYSKSALHKAVENGDIDAVKLLISYGANVNYRDSLFRATPLLLAAAEGYLDVFEFLVKQGSELDIRDAWHRSCLHWASANGHIEIVQWLFQYYTGSKVGPGNRRKVDLLEDELISRDWKKRTCLQLAVQGGHFEVAELLLEYGSETNCRDMQYMTPLMYSAQKGDGRMVKLLLQFKADKSLTNRAGKTATALAEENNDRLICNLLADGHSTQIINIDYDQ